MDMQQFPPASTVRMTDPLLIAVAAVCSYALCFKSGMSSTYLACLISLAVLITAAGMEIYYAPWRRLAHPRIRIKTLFGDWLVKFLGLMAGYGLTLLCWKFVPEFARAGYDPFFNVAAAALVYMPVAIGLFTLFTEWRLGPQEDHAWHMGQFVLGRWRRVDRIALRHFLMGWLVRAIFLPLNFSALAQLISRFRGQESQLPGMPFDQAQYIIISMISAVMVAAIVPGYFFSSRLLGTHIRKVDATITGWLATMACYPPLMQVIFLQWLNFYPHMDRAKWGTPWSVELAGFPMLAIAAGVSVILLEVIHYWGEASFGLRASNLSNRGIITNGLFRITKHPIYLVKCIIWLLWMPFLAGDNALHSTWLMLLWAGACAIYAARAWAEERLLADDPDYAAYALWMDKHGLFRALSRNIPFFRFEWRQERWKNNDCCTA